MTAFVQIPLQKLPFSSFSHGGLRHAPTRPAVALQVYTPCAAYTMLQGDFTPRRGRRWKVPSATFVERTPLRLAQDDLDTPTTTARGNCLSWDLHEAAATRGGAEAVRRYLVGGGDPGSDQWGNSALHVSRRRLANNFPWHQLVVLSARMMQMLRTQQQHFLREFYSRTNTAICLLGSRGDVVVCTFPSTTYIPCKTNQG